ncbi:hypothetical protein SOPP22_03425 [Shewanella sp. OPT22]|nr:hypothetical protein SOPP22_03425 [Shewanella sp. OPT22]
MKRELSALVFGLMLAGCGGSSGSKKDDSAKAVTPPTPTVSAETVYRAAKCDIETPASNVRFFVHEKNGGLLSEAQSQSGAVSIPWGDNAQHLTIAYEDISSDGSKTLSIRSELELTSGDLGKITLFDSRLNQQCNCQNVTFDLSQIRSFYSDDYYDIFIDSSRAYGSEIFTTEFCASGDSLSPVSVIIRPISDGERGAVARIELDQHVTGSVIQLTPNLFDAEENQGRIVNVASNREQQNFWTFARTEHGHEGYSSHGAYIPQIYPGIFDNNYIETSSFDTIFSNESSYVEYYTSKSEKIVDIAATYDMTLPEKESGYTLLAETRELLEGFGVGSETEYDFAGSHAGYQELYMRLYGDDIPSWRVYAPIKGQIPELSLPSDIEQQFDTDKSASFILILSQYNTSGTFNDYRAERAKFSKSDSLLWPAYFDNHQRDSIRIVNN